MRRCSAPRGHLICSYLRLYCGGIVKQVFWFLCASILPALIGGSLASVAAQTSSPTPDPFVSNSLSSPGPTFSTVMGDISANGRFVVFVSNGDVSTEKTATQKQCGRQSRDLFGRLRATPHLPDHEYQKRSESSTDSESDANAKSNTNAEPDANSGANAC